MNAIDPVLPENPVDRRRFLGVATAGAGTLALGGRLAWRGLRDPDQGLTSPCFIARAPSYEVDLERPIRDGLAALGFGPDRVRGKVVLLKPNQVEAVPDAPHVTTNPAVVRAAAAVFRGLGAKSVLVAEGPGHSRDTALVLDTSGLGDVLDAENLPFIDLNRDEVEAVPNRFGATDLHELYIPRSVLRADIVVSMPKMKTHHWMGATLSMKNLFGVLPGAVYGWPKNVLHQVGIAGSVLDIAAAVRPSLAIIDGIVGMEGDGPLLGTPKQAGALVLGTNLVAADATACRLMRIDPALIPYLNDAAGVLGPIGSSHIDQRGDRIDQLATRFNGLAHPAFPRLR
jgi:uncharacterized protein (DUF362 family)